MDNRRRRTRRERDEQSERPLRLQRNTTNSDIAGEDIVHLPDIHPHLFLCSSRVAKRLQGSNLSVICVARRKTCSYMKEKYQKLNKQRNLLPARQSFVEVDDDPRLDKDVFFDVFDSAADYIEQSIRKRVTVVHCHAGINRSVTAILAWLIKHTTESMEDAIQYIRKMNYRHRGRPALANSRFEDLLHKFAHAYSEDSD